jgi:hypothetical protein
MSTVDEGDSLCVGTTPWRALFAIVAAEAEIAGMARSTRTRRGVLAKLGGAWHGPICPLQWQRARGQDRQPADPSTTSASALSNAIEGRRDADGIPKQRDPSACWWDSSGNQINRWTGHGDIRVGTGHCPCRTTGDQGLSDTASQTWARMASSGPTRSPDEQHVKSLVMCGYRS